MYRTALFYCLFPVIVGLIVMQYREELMSIVKSKVIGAAHYKLVVGVLSARDHFAQRQAIRETWWRHIQENKTLSERVDVKFVIGDSACGVPLGDRIDPFSCQPWFVSTADSGENIPFMEEVKDSTKANEEFPHNYGVHSVPFAVHHSVVLQQLGIHMDSVGNKAVARLLETSSKTEIISAEFSKKAPGQLLGGYRYKPVEPYLLPKGFEGILQVENLSDGHMECHVTSRQVQVKVNVGGGVLRLVQTPSDSGEHYTDPLAWNSTHIPLVSMMYQLHEKEVLEHHTMTGGERSAEWENQLDKESDRLREETDTHNDLVFVSVTDVYRNIPDKLLKFYTWLSEKSSFEFVLKTDDDCYLDVERVLTELEAHRGTEKLWWGRFRRNWAVEHHGKWADFAYPAPAYPAFACGVGSVISADLVQWMADNAHLLNTFQGEDVSVGIWLAAVGPHYQDDPRWQCDRECLSDMVAMPQLTSDQLRQTWSDKLRCGDPCGCS